MYMVTTQKKLVAIYVRKSRLKDSGALEIDRQVQLLIDYADVNNMDYEIFSEEGSSEDWEGRPELQRMLMALKRNIYDGVLVTDQDRLTRDHTDFGLFVRFMRNEGLQLYTLNKTYNFMNDDDIFTSGIQSEMDNHFMRMTKRKLKRGRIQALKKGVFFGNPPYGYTKDEFKHLMPHPVESEVVQEMFDMYVIQKLNQAEIAETLAMKGVFTRTGALFTNRTISHILSNIAYRGVVQYSLQGEDSIIVEEAHPALVTAEVFTQAQIIRSERRAVPQGIQRGVYPLSKLLVCPKCGQTLSFSKHYGSYKGKKTLDKDELVLYVLNCHSSKSPARKLQTKHLPRCTNNGIKADRVLPLIMDDLKSKLADIDTEIEGIIAGDSSFISEVAKKQQELTLRYNQLEYQKKKVQDGFKMGIYEADEATAEIKSIKETQMKVELKLKNLDGADAKSEVDRKRKLKVKVEQLLNMDEPLEPVKSNRLLREVIDRVYYWKEKNDIGEERPFELQIIYK